MERLAVDIAQPDICYVGGEVRNPERVIPRSILIAIGAVAVLYLTMNITIVGVIPWPTVFRLSEEEVERVFTVPLSWLADARNRWELPFPGSTRGVVVYHPFDGELVWGATARMTVDFIKTLGL